MDKVPVYILAGGKSTRLGTDKARLDIRGTPLLQHVATSLRPVASRITVVADAMGKYDDLGFETIGDQHPGLGPLGGLQTALAHHTGGNWLLLASCDRIGIQAEWVRALLSARAESSGAVTFADERIQPMPALFHALIAAQVATAIQQNDLSPWRLIRSVEPVVLPLPAGWENSHDINDINDLECWLRRG